MGSYTPHKWFDLLKVEPTPKQCQKMKIENEAVINSHGKFFKYVILKLIWTGIDQGHHYRLPNIG